MEEPASSEQSTRIPWKHTSEVEESLLLWRVLWKRLPQRNRESSNREWVEVEHSPAFWWKSRKDVASHCCLIPKTNCSFWRALLSLLQYVCVKRRRLCSGGLLLRSSDSRIDVLRSECNSRRKNIRSGKASDEGQVRMAAHSIRWEEMVSLLVTIFFNDNIQLRFNKIR